MQTPRIIWSEDDHLKRGICLCRECLKNSYDYIERFKPSQIEIAPLDVYNIESFEDQIIQKEFFKIVYFIPCPGDHYELVSVDRIAYWHMLYVGYLPNNEKHTLPFEVWETRGKRYCT